MDEYRSTVRGGAGADESAGRKSERSLIDVLIPRTERRTVNQRREQRYHGVVDRAAVEFRRKKILVTVVNVSESGLMIEAPIIPRIGEEVRVTFEGHKPIQAVVRWVRSGRIGLDVGEGAIKLG